MRYIARLYDQEELRRVRALLRSKGVPTYVTTVQSSRMGLEMALYVCIDAQAEDALKILRDPTHRPAAPVDAEAFEKAIGGGDTMSIVVKYATWLLLIVVIASLAVFGIDLLL